MTPFPEESRRRSLRLPTYDYASPGAYFVTFCVSDQECLLGEVIDGEMRLSLWGRIVQKCWQAIPGHFPNVELDAFVVMPNHVHGIVMILPPPDGDDGVPAEVLPPKNSPGERPKGPGRGSLGTIVGSVKSAASREINATRSQPGARVWQRNYWEHVIRDEASMDKIRRYMETNPDRWAEDCFFRGSPASGPAGSQVCG